MDCQPSALDVMSKPDEFLTRVAAAISTVRKRGVQIGFVRMAFDDSDLAAVLDTNKMLIGIASRPNIHPEAPETAVHERVAPEAGDIVVRKTRVGAFSTTDLDQQLRHRGITNLILAGISTSGVVLSTVRDAADRDYRMYVLADVTADRDPEVHDILIQKVFPRQAYIINTTELATLLSADWHSFLIVQILYLSSFRKDPALYSEWKGYEGTRVSPFLLDHSTSFRFPPFLLFHSNTAQIN